MPEPKSTLLQELEVSVEERMGEFHLIDADRRAALDPVSDFVVRRVSSQEPSPLIFICTHNSRRSHMAQLWALVAARHFSVPGIEALSGGTEATSFNPRAVAALRRAGFSIEFFTDGKNPVYEVRRHDLRLRRRRLSRRRRGR